MVSGDIFIPLSSFLQRYDANKYEWEVPDYCSKTSFLWSRSDLLRPETNDSFSVEMKEDTLSDMSISTLSDMSISVSSVSSSAKEDYETCSLQLGMHNGNTASTGLRSFSHDLESRMQRPVSATIRKDEDDNEAYIKILEWLTSLFVCVAGSVLEYSTCLDDANESSMAESRDRFDKERPAPSDPLVLEVTSGGSLEDLFLPAVPLVKLNRGVSRELKFYDKASKLSFAPDPIRMYPENDLEDPELPTTAKQVCMWGRRLERIPKVRISGQKEAVYCFDSRKQRTKQALTKVIPSTISSASAAKQPTQIFYRSRPLHMQHPKATNASQVLSTYTPPDAIKITQRHVLLQNVKPVHFDSKDAHSKASVQQRVPFSSQTNSSITHTGKILAEEKSSFLVKKFTGRPFI